MEEEHSSKPVLLLLGQLPPPIHGVANVNQQIVQSAIIREKVTIDALNLSTSRTIEDIDVFSLGKVWRSIVIGLVLCKRLLFQRPDAVYMTFTPSGKALYRDVVLGLLVWMAGVRRIYHFHGKGMAESWRSKRWLRPLIRLLFKRARVIHLSPLLYYDIADIADIADSEAVAYVANGIPDMFAGKMPERDGRSDVPVILFLSNIVESKGAFVLLEALHCLKEKGIAFRAEYAGAWYGTEARFKTLVADYGLDGAVDYLGVVGPDAKRAAFERADIFAFPTMHDSFPLAVLEAMSAGLPVISTDEGAIPEILSENAGMICPKGNVEVLEAYITRCLEDQHYRLSYGNAARHRYEAHYTNRHFEARMASLFSQWLRHS